MKNYGLLIRKQLSPTDDIFGAVSRSIGQEKQNVGGQWVDYLPIGERQYNSFMDSMSCVSYSALNCIEILQKYIWGDNVNYSDRFLAKMSGTTQNGNYTHIVADTLRNVGVVEEQDWPMVGKTWDEYMDEIPDKVKEKANYFHEKYDVKYEFVRKADIVDALEYAPLQVGVYAWPKPVDGVYSDVQGKARNHLVTLIGYEKDKHWLIFDHYENFVKKLAWDYNFGSTIKFSIDLKPNEKPMLRNNVLVQLVDPPGGFALHLDGKLIIADTANLVATWIMRNNGKTEGQVACLHKIDWDKFPKFNLKGEKI